MPAASVGKNKFDIRWMDGVWLGIKLESGKSIIGAAEGVVEAVDFRREPEEGWRWSSEGIDGFKGLPWEPYQGAGGGFEINLKVGLPADNETITINIEGRGEYAPRRMRITKKDLEKFGFAVGCAGCRAANLGSTAVGQTEQYRKMDHGTVGKCRRRED